MLHVGYTVSVEASCMACRLHSIGRRLLDLLQVTQYLKRPMGWHAGYIVSIEAFCVAFRLHSICRGLLCGMQAT